MTPKELRARTKDKARLILSLHDTFLGNVYQKQEEVKLQQMAELVLENPASQNSDWPCFMFEGKWYTYPWNLSMPWNTADCNRTLDPALMKRAFGIMHGNTFEETRQKALIRSYIGKVLAACEHIDDLRELLPDEMWQLSPEQCTDMWHLYEGGQLMSQDKKDALLQSTEEAREALAGLYMMDLLMRNVKES